MAGNQGPGSRIEAIAVEKFGKMGALMAMTGSAVGLGCLWRFPYLLGENGGAAFLLLFILSTLVIALPIFIAEFIIGRRSGKDCYGAFKCLSAEVQVASNRKAGPERTESGWRLAGAVTLIIPIIITSYYSVIGGWSLQYLFKALAYNFTETDMTVERLNRIFSDFSSSALPPLLSHTMFMGLSALIVLAGVKRGIENFGKIAMPGLAVILVIIAVYVAFLPGALDGYFYLFRPDFSRISAETVLEAMGQAFYSMSIGIGCIITYASYVRKKDSVVFHCGGTALIGLLFAVIAGCAFIPAVFAFGKDPAAGPALVYETLPFIFSHMPGGSYVAILFFVGLNVAALTSIISMIEVVTSFLIAECGLSRRKAVILLTSVCWASGCLCSLSFGPLADVKIAGLTLFSALDKFSSNVLMPSCALFTVLFVGWKMKKDNVRDEFTSGGEQRIAMRLFGGVYFLIRYVAPVAVLFIMLGALFIR